MFIVSRRVNQTKHCPRVWFIGLDASIKLAGYPLLARIVPRMDGWQ